jgi:quinohemoprotein ethanol dehydrogenase
MIRMRAACILAFISCLALVACQRQQPPAPAAAAPASPTPAGAPARSPALVNAARLAAADQEPGQWMSHGRTYDEQRYSPLERINAGTAA